MAEAVSLALAVVSLAGLFNDAIADFEYVQLGKDFSKDFEICRIKLACQQLRLSRWGAAIGINGETQATDSLRELSVKPEEIKTAEQCLGLIASMFMEYRDKSDKYKVSHDSQEVLSDDTSGQADDGGSRSLRTQMHTLVLARQQQTGLLKKIKWAVYERKQFDRLYEDLRDLVDKLVDLWPATKKRQQDICKEEAGELSKEKAVGQLRAIAAKDDKELEAAFAATEEKRTDSGSNVLSGSFSRIGQMFTGGSHSIRDQTFNVS